MINNNQKGVSIYITVIILSVLLSASLGLSSIIVGGAKISQSLGDSVKAFHAADTGVEKAWYNIRMNGECDGTLASGTFETDYSYEVVVTYGGGTCPGGDWIKIESLGEYNGTKRKVESFYEAE